MRLRAFFVLTLALAAAADARAAFVVTIGNATVAAGSATTVDVTISGGPELLDQFGVEFRIAPFAGGPFGDLKFTIPQSNSQLSAPNYVFAGDTLLGTGNISTVGAPNDTYIGGDGTLSGAGVTVGPGNSLLIRLDVSALTALAGNQFTISLVPSTSTFFFSPNTEVNNGVVAFTSTSGLVTVTPSGPELVSPAPPTVVAGMLGAGGLMLARWGAGLRRRRA